MKTEQYKTLMQLLKQTQNSLKRLNSIKSTFGSVNLTSERPSL